MSTKKRHRRTPQEMIADLEAQIARVKARAERQKAKKDPSLRYMSSALRSIEKALDFSEDVATRQGLDEARATLTAVLTLNGALAPAGGGRAAQRRRRGGRVQREAVVRFVTEHPGSRCEDIASALGADTKSVSPVLKALKDDGEVRAVGQARGTRYHPPSGR